MKHGTRGKIAALLAMLVVSSLLSRPVLAQRAVTAADSARMSINARAISLDEAVRAAEGASEIVRIAGNSVLRASGQVNQARSSLFPQLGATGSYTRTLASQFQNAFGSSSTDTTTRVTGPPGPCSQYLFSSDSSTIARVNGLENYARCTVAGNGTGSSGGIDFSKVGFGSKNAYTLGLSGSQALFSGGRISGQIDAANATRRSAQIELTAQRAQLKLDVVTAYYDASLSDRLLEIAQSTLQQTEELLRQTTLQQNVGNVSEFDLLRAQVAVSNQRPAVLQAASNRDIAYLRFKQLLNIPYEQRITLSTPVEDSTTIITGVDLARARTPDTLTARRASVREAAEAVTVGRGQLRVAHAERIPSLTLSSAYSRVAYPANVTPSLADFRPNWTVTLATSFPIFTGGRIRGDEMVAEANLRDAKARLDQAREYAALDARVALSTLEQAESSLLASAGTAQAATRAYSIAEVRFREGISTQLELSDTRNQLAQALVNRAQAARNAQIARIRLALLPDLPLQTTGAGQSALSQQQQQNQQIQQQSPSQAAQGVGASSGSGTSSQTGQTGTIPGSTP